MWDMDDTPDIVEIAILNAEEEARRRAAADAAYRTPPPEGWGAAWDAKNDRSIKLGYGELPF